jgi:RNA polymerase sigma factor (sigma-70 family)
MENEALTSTFTVLRQRLLRLSQKIVGNEDDAADAVQEAFCRLWQRREQISSQNEAEGVSVITVHNISIDTVRRRSARRMTDIDDAKDLQSEDNSKQEREEAYNEVKKIIDEQLTDLQRKIVIMREYESYSFEEIAKTVGMTPGNVRVQLSRARKLVREIYRNKTKEL